MLKALWAVSAALLLGALAMALLARGMDAAGSGILWFVPLAIAVALGACFLANRAGALSLALALALVGPVIAAGIFLTLGRSLLAEREEESGAAYWKEPAQRALARAIVAGDTAAMKAATLVGADVNQAGKDAMTMLAFTITHKPDMVAAVIQLGADPDHAMPGQVTPLVHALHASDPALQQLLQGCGSNGPGDSESAIIFGAINSQIPRNYEVLVAHGADVKRLDAAGGSTMMAAAESRQWKIALDLLSRGVDPGIVSTRGTSITAVVERARSTYGADADYQAFAAELSRRITNSR